MSSDTLAAQRAGLIRDICEHPGRYDLRLIFADWCEDHGEPERAEFVRLQMEYADLHPHYEAHDIDYLNCPTCIRAAIIEGLLKTRFRIGRNEHPTWAKDCPSIIMRTKPTGPALEWQWYRGFVESITCPWSEWEKCGPRLVECHPLRRVTLSDKEPLNLAPGSTNPDDTWHGWHTWGSAEFVVLGGPLASDLPKELFALLGGRRIEGNPFAVYYESREEAVDDCSLACVNFARKKAGLPMIHP